MAAWRWRSTRPTATGKSCLRSVALAILIGLVALYLYAQLVRRSTMFVPSKFPEGMWNTAGLPVQPQEVTFVADDGVRLHGWLFRCSGGLQPAGGILIWFHGNAGNVCDRAPIAAELARRGVATLVFDWRGYGKSEGRPSESGLFRDALAAYAFARTISDDIAVYGESLGGPYAAYVAAHRKVRCVVIENSFPSLRAIGNALYRPLPLGWFVPFALDTVRWLNAANVPVLVLHGRNDAVIPFALGQQLYDNLRVPKEFVISETGGHCEMATSDSDRYYDSVVRFVSAATTRPAPATAAMQP